MFYDRLGTPCGTPCFIVVAGVVDGDAVSVVDGDAVSVGNSKCLWPAWTTVYVDDCGVCWEFKVFMAGLDRCTC